MRPLAILPALALLALPIPAASAQTLIELSSPNSEPGGRFGTAVSSVGDVDLDGTPDVLVAAPGETVGGLAAAGRVYVLSGATRQVLRTFESPNPQANGAFGWSIDSVGDQNGDGTVDVIVGAPFESRSGAASAGNVYVLSGANGTDIVSLTPPQPVANATWGYAVTEIANQGAAQVLGAGAPGDNQFAADAGAAFLYRSQDGVQFYASLSIPEGTRAGVSVASADFDGDGQGDFAFSAPGANNPAIRVEPGGAGPIARFSPPDGATEFGRSLDGVGDRTGDGQADLLVGAFGAVYLYSGATSELVRTYAAPEPLGGGDFGLSVAGAGDIDDQGAADLIVGAPTLDVGGVSMAGRVYLYAGDSDALLYSVASPTPSAEGQFGWAVARVGTVDADNLADQVVGAPGEDDGAGRAYLLLSPPATSSDPAVEGGLSLSVSPNPASLAVRVVATAAAPGTVEVYDPLGRVVATQPLQPQRPLTISSSAWAPGVYTVRLWVGSESVTERVVVAR